jgi:hypothetical protein
MKSKRGQQTIEMSFNWIFAVILIIIFIFVAVYGIKYFMNLSSCSTVGFAYDDLQKEVDNAYQSDFTEREATINLPGIQMICFANLSKPITGNSGAYDEINIYEFEDANTFLIPPEKACTIPFYKIKHLNLDKITEVKNPYCIEVIDGKATFTVSMDYYEKAVTIK